MKAEILEIFLRNKNQGIVSSLHTVIDSDSMNTLHFEPVLAKVAAAEAEHVMNAALWLKHSIQTVH